MGLTGRKPRPLNRKIPFLRDTRLIVIATEGLRTEKQYFDIFKNTKVQVIVIPTENSSSAPEYIIERLNEYSEEYQIGVDDELWLMLDTDRWGDRKLSTICQVALQKDYYLAISNPCFEVWLYLHIENIPGNISRCSEVKQLLRNEIGSYNPSNFGAR